MQSGSMIARVVLVLVATAASIGLASLYFFGDGHRSEPASTEQPASPTVAERTPDPAPAPEPVRPPDPSTPPLSADPAPQAAAPAPEPSAPTMPPAPAPTPEPAPMANAAPATNLAPAGSDLVDINTASVDEINRIKGVGLPGKSIVKNRPYKSVDELLTKKAVKPATFKKIKDKVTVR